MLCLLLCLSQAPRCALGREEQHQDAEGFLCFHLACFPRLCELCLESWCHGPTALPNCCVVSLSHTFLSLVSSAELPRQDKEYGGSSFPSPPCPHPGLERNTAFSFPLRSAGEHRLLQCVHTVLGIRSGQLLPCSCWLAGMWQRA